jgi:hypothetical protein
MALSQSEIYSLAKSVGLSDSRAKVAAAIAMAESGGDPNAHNSKPPDDSYGLWQINMLGAMGPNRRAHLGLKDNAELHNPQINAKAMKWISQDGGNFSPWSTYTNGSYLKFLNNPVTDETKDPNWIQKISKWAGLPFAPLIDPESPVAGGLSTADSIGDAVQVLGKASLWMSNPENWLRVGYVVGGAVLGIAGVVMVLQSTQIGRAVSNVVPVGRVANIVKGR